ncbi:MAG: hypothetical protein JW723_07320 [Bacteroidales bacterium]|nr:hypothetical protein [Bacteroidales bacterium]
MDLPSEEELILMHHNKATIDGQQQQTLAMLMPVDTIGVLPSTIASSSGSRSSAMAARTTTIRTTQTEFVLFGLLTDFKIKLKQIILYLFNYFF